MTSQEILGIINGVRLTLEGKSDLSNYRYRAPIDSPIVCSWLPEIVRNEKDVYLLAIALAWNNVFHYNLEKKQCVALLYDWASRYIQPSSVLKDVEIGSPTDLRNLVKDGGAGPFLLTGIIQKRIHPITYCYIEKITGCTKSWNSIYWKMYKRKFEVLSNVVDIPRERMLKLHNYLIDNFKENQEA